LPKTGGTISNTVLLLGILAMVIVFSQFAGMIYFKNHPDAMNEPFVNSQYHAGVLWTLFIISLGLLISFAFTKAYFNYRLITLFITTGLLIVLYLWWYKILPYLY